MSKHDIRLSKTTEPSPLRWLEQGGPPSSSAHFADLELVRSISRGINTAMAQGYRGGGGLGPATSRNSVKSAVVLGSSSRREEGIEEGKEGAEEEIGIVGEDTVVLETEKRAQEMYDRFSERRKSVIVGIVSFAGLLGPFSSSSFLPSIPSIVVDLQTSPTILDISVAIFILVLGISPLIYANYAGVYGRKPIYVVSLPIFALGSLGVALSPNLTSLFVTRIIQAFGASAVLSVGAGTIGDLYPRQRRGKHMGLFYAGVLLGPSFAPVIAGVLTEYAKPTGAGWRAMQWLLFSLGCVASALVVFFLPETSHFRGIDVIRKEKADRRKVAEIEALAKGQPLAKVVVRSGFGGRLFAWYDDWVWLNPLAPLRMLAHPHVLAMSFVSSFVLMSTYTILVPLGETLAPKYGITNSAILGCLYLAQGIGNITAAQFTGQYSDWMLKRWGKKRGTYVPEDRLKAALWGAGLVLPVTVLTFGWVVEKGTGTVALVFSIILLVVDGGALMSVLTPSNTYIVDVFQHRSAEVIAVNNCVRYTFSAAASAFVLPMIQQVGIGWTNTFSAGLVWIGFALILLVIRYGETLRNTGERWEGKEKPAVPA